MKIKSDFITNSSSTAYIVLVPNTYQLTKEGFERACKEVKASDCNFIIPDLDLCEEYFETLKEGLELFVGDYDDSINQTMWDVITNICEAEKFILGDLNIDCENTIKGIDQDRIEDIIFNHIDLQKIIETCNKKGVENDKNVTKK